MINFLSKIFIIILLSGNGHSVFSTQDPIDFQQLIALQYQKFLQLSPQDIKTALPNLSDHLPKAVKFVVYLEKYLKEDYSSKLIAMIISRGIGVGGISPSTQASPEAQKIMLSALHKALNNGATPDDLGLKDRPSSQTFHHQVIAAVVEEINKKPHWVTKDFETDPKAYGDFTHALHFRLAAQKVPLTKAESTPSLTFGGIKMSNVYGKRFPQAPMINTYDPTEVSFPVLAQLPSEDFRAFLPFEIQRDLGDTHSSQVDIFFVIQSSPEAGPLLRPHGWLDPQAPTNNHGYNKNFHTVVSFYPAKGPFTIQQKIGPQTHGFSVHAAAPYGNLVFSPNNCPIDAVINQRTNEEAFSFWSSVQANGRIALTLHCIFRPYEYDFWKIEQNVKTFSDLMDEIQGFSDLKDMGF